MRCNLQPPTPGPLSVAPPLSPLYDTFSCTGVRSLAPDCFVSCRAAGLVLQFARQAALFEQQRLHVQTVPVPSTCHSDLSAPSTTVRAGWTGIERRWIRFPLNEPLFAMFTIHAHQLSPGFIIGVVAGLGFTIATGGTLRNLRSRSLGP